MNILLDTHAFIWYFQGNEQLSSKVLEILENSDNSLYLSIVNLWEIAIKINVGKLSLEISFFELQSTLDQLLIKVLPISFSDVQFYIDLPLYHRDPFDRILIAQAVNHSLHIVSADVVFDAYPIQRVWS